MIRNRKFLGVRDSCVGGYRDRVDGVIDCFQERKKKIDEEIMAIKKVKTLNLKCKD